MLTASQVPIFFGSSAGSISKPIGMAFTCQCCPETPLRDVAHEGVATCEES